MLASITIFVGASLGAEAFLLRGSEPALGSRWPLRRNDWTEIRSGERDEEGHASTFSKAVTVFI